MDSLLENSMTEESINTETPKEEDKIYRYNIIDPVVEHKRLSMLIWGKSGCGKTELAATAPGNKLFINFDPDGYDTLKPYSANSGYPREGTVKVLDLASEKDSIVKEFKEETTPMIRGIIKYLEENPECKTVVVDSLTSFGEKALAFGVKDAAGTAKGRGSTLEDPGFAGYGRKNTWTIYLVKTLLQITGRLNRNIIFLAHEGVPDKDKEGVVMQISIMIGGNLAETVPLQISEVWALTDTGKERRIAIRPVRARKPMKTRMFKTQGKQEFLWKYDAETQTGDAIDTWYEQWSKASGKIEVPK